MWQEVDNKLCKSFTFSSFTNAFAWMAKVAFIAEKMDHHPEWTNIYNKVDVKLYTHSANNSITEKDRKLAAAIDKLTI